MSNESKEQLNESQPTLQSGGLANAHNSSWDKKCGKSRAEVFVTLKNEFVYAKSAYIQIQVKGRKLLMRSVFCTISKLLNTVINILNMPCVICSLFCVWVFDIANLFRRFIVI